MRFHISGFVHYGKWPAPLRTLILLAALSQLACDKMPAADRSPSQTSDLVIRLDPAKTYQQIHSFGASDCWTAKYIGQWKDAAKKNHIADLLFSTDTLADGAAKGIGLSLWRFNIGAGSLQQGAASNISDPWRREACFLDPQGHYDWTQQSGQQWFLEAARQRGVRYTLGFSLTPPVFMTANGKAYNDSGTAHLNIKKGYMNAYAGFLARVTKHFGFDYLSPINEPQWQWGKVSGASQEGTQATNTEIAALARALNDSLKGTTAKILIAEAGQWDYLYSKNEEDRGNQIYEFFAPASANYVGALDRVAPVITGHSYFTTCPDAAMNGTRNTLRNAVQAVHPAPELWQTEFGILGNICNQYQGAPRHTGMDYGLYVSKVLHYDLAVANVSSWQWWLAMSPYNYSDALVYINAPSGEIDPQACLTDGIVSTSKQLWVLGNYSRFVRPGMQRIEASVGAGANNGFWASAYRDAGSQRLVVVCTNSSIDSRELRVEGLNTEVDLYITDVSRNLKKMKGKAGQITLPPLSVVTVVGSYL